MGFDPSLQARERNTLGVFRARGGLRYKDMDAYFCTACETVIGVECPNCKTKSGDHRNTFDVGVFVVERPLTTDRYMGAPWTKVYCRKCDFAFHILVR
jgi:hypothetical protein